MRHIIHFGKLSLNVPLMFTFSLCSNERGRDDLTRSRAAIVPSVPRASSTPNRYLLFEFHNKRSKFYIRDFILHQP